MTVGAFLTTKNMINTKQKHSVNKTVLEEKC